MLRLLRWIVYVVVVLAMNFPILVTLITSFKTTREISNNPGLLIEQPTLDNYLKVLTDTERFNIFLYLANSAAAALIGTLLAIVLAFPAAYVIARSETGQKLLLPLVINLRAVPLVVFAIPLYMMYQWLGLLDTRIGLGLILTIVNIPLALVMLVNAISDIPVELDEAATVDGASVFQIMIRVIWPVIRPALVTTFIFGFITAWNEFLFALAFTSDSDSQTIPVGIANFTNQYYVPWGDIAAASAVVTVPLIILVLFFQRHIIEGLTQGGIKE